MSTGRTWQTESTSLDNTLELAAALGQRLKGGEVIELRSDLGGGKTAFVRGLVKGLGSPDRVHSPSFTVANEYKAGGLTLHHFDFYRLQDPGILKEELAEVLQDPKAVVAIEWADIVEDVLPAGHLAVTITATGETTRTFAFEYPENLNYLFPDNT
jgi:tRNA threonylcarbamoyladenosine biosynthesis protein TsaE